MKIFYRRTDRGIDFPTFGADTLDIRTDTEERDDRIDENDILPYGQRHHWQTGDSAENHWVQVEYDTDTTRSSLCLSEGCNDMGAITDMLIIEGAIIRHCGRTPIDDWDTCSRSYLVNADDRDSCEAFFAAVGYAYGPQSEARQRRALDDD